MAKQPKTPSENKEPKQASELFHNILKASVKGNPKPKEKTKEIMTATFHGKWVYSKKPEKEGMYLVWGFFNTEDDEVRGYFVGAYDGSRWHFTGGHEPEVICWMKLTSSPSEEK